MRIDTEICFLSLALALVPLSAQAQQQQTGGNGLNTANVKGELEALQGYTLKIKDEAGETLMVMANPQMCSINYSGEAEPEFLTPGLMVRFTATFDSKGIPTHQIGELEIFSPVRKRRMSRQEIQKQTAGIYPAEDDEEKGKDQVDAAPRNTRQSSRTRTRQQTPQKYLVVGKLMGTQAKKIAVRAGNRTVQVELAEEPSIQVQYGDLSFCQPGDKLEIVGMSRANQANFVQAQQVKVTANKKLAPPENPRRRDKKGEKPK